MMKQKNIAIFASGSGSNAVKIIEYFYNKSNARVALIVCNNAKAGILSRPQVENISKVVVDRDTFNDSQRMFQYLDDHHIDLIILAGFLWKIPLYLIERYPNRIVNIHPALLPSYGGKGMYGIHVHRAVFENRELQSGITIHYVNENYDEGNTIFQATCTVGDADSPEEIARRVLILEHQYFAQVIEQTFLQSP